MMSMLWSTARLHSSKTGASSNCLGTRGPREIHIASLLVKPDKLKVDLNIEYVAMNIPNDFIVGYGLDYDGFGRNYPDIYTVVD